MQNFSKERWINIPGYEGSYMVSNIGRVTSLDREATTKTGKKRFYKGKILKFGFHPFGYPKVNLCSQGSHECRFVHRLVCESFRGPKDKPYEVAHKDGNPKNCRLKNVIWCLPVENQAHRKIHGTLLIREKHPMAKLNEMEVSEIKASLNRGVSQYKIAKIYNVCRTTIQAIATGRSWR